MLMTIEQLAVHLSVSARQVQRLTAAGMPSIPVGARSRRYDPQVCAAWLQENMQTAQAPGSKPPGPALPSSSDYTAGYRKQRIRVMPGASKRT